MCCCCNNELDRRHDPELLFLRWWLSDDESMSAVSEARGGVRGCSERRPPGTFSDADEEEIKSGAQEEGVVINRDVNRSVGEYRGPE